MHGINRSQHKHVLDALLHLERLLKQSQSEAATIEHTTFLRIKLEDLYNDYEILLEELATHIKVYELLLNHVKVQYLGKKGKKLKKDVADKTQVVPIPIESDSLKYGT